MHIEFPIDESIVQFWDSDWVKKRTKLINAVVAVSSRHWLSISESIHSYLIEKEKQKKIASEKFLKELGAKNVGKIGEL